MANRITRRSEQIGDEPFSGRKVPEYQADDIRELIEKPYRIIYRIKPDQIGCLAAGKKMTPTCHNLRRRSSITREWTKYRFKRPQDPD
jgi:hypothetical protein